MNRDIQTRVMYLFERVGEPLFLGPRGSTNVLYEVPNLSPQQRHASETLRRQLTGAEPTLRIVPSMVNLANVPTPNLANVGRLCPKSEIFSYFINNHRSAANEVRTLLIREQNIDNFISLACACRDSTNVNTDLWVFAFASACLARRDMRGFRMPALYEVLPSSFFDPHVMRQAQQQAVVPAQDRMVIEIPRNFTADSNNREAALAYYREDIGINSHHWHWHLIYTGLAPRTGAGSRDRKGELFYYMHHSMLARYDAERLCNNLEVTTPLDLTQGNTRLPEGYFPKLTDSNSGRIWGSRQENTNLTAVSRPNENLETSPNLIRQWTDRIAEAIDTRTIMNSNGERVVLTPETGIDILGDMIENGGTVSPNQQFYGDMHNMGHVLIAFSHDPLYRHREASGVMGDPATAMRDPAFYRWHKFVDDLFTRYKVSLQPYTRQELVWQGVQVSGVTVQTPNERPNILVTHWTQSDVDLSRGMDFGRSPATVGGAVWARFSHLNNRRFTYQINVTNSGAQAVSGTVRIFMAPRNNIRGERLNFRDQRLLFFELDKFTTDLQPGNNVITRNSQDSTLVIPWADSFRDLESLPADPANIRADQAVCGCGWPEHMLLPRGSPSGVTFDLFVMVTNGAEDAVARTSTQSAAQRQGCKDAVAYCGILDELYPDRKPMGFPFDRNANQPNNPSTPIANLDEFIPAGSNMFATQVIIRHSNTTTIRGGGAPPSMGRIDQEGNAMTGPTPTNATANPSRGNQAGTPGRPRQPGQGQPQQPPRQAQPQQPPRGAQRQPTRQPATPPQRVPQPSRPSNQGSVNFGGSRSNTPSRSPSPQGWTNVGWGNSPRGFSPTNNFWG